MDDLMWAVGYMSDEIVDGAVYEINEAYRELEEAIKIEFSKKIDELSQLL